MAALSQRAIALRLQFVIQNGERIDRRCVTAEHQWSETDGKSTRAFYRVELRGCEVSFGTNPNADGFRVALVILAKVVEMLARMTGVALQRRDKRKIKFFFSSQKCLRRDRNI